MAVHQFSVLFLCISVFLQPLHTIDHGDTQFQKLRLQRLRQLQRPPFRQLPVLLFQLPLFLMHILKQTVQFL